MQKSYYIHTFGCQMNHSDSERFVTILEQIGYKPNDNWKTSDLIIFNTCSVRQKAEDRVIGMGPQIEQIKKANPELKIVLTGCMARRTWRPNESETSSGRGSTSAVQMPQDAREEELKTIMPWVDVVIETKDFAKLPTKLGFRKEIIDEEPAHYLSYDPKYNKKFQAFVPISTGCDHFCTFCIVPFARGSEVCRSAESIISEVFNLVSEGCKDITLLGQTVNRWVNPDFDEEIKQGMIANTKIPVLNTRPMNDADLEKWNHYFHNFDGKLTSDSLKQTKLAMPKDFLQLLQVLDQIEGQWWSTWVSSHPNYMTDELLQFIGDSVQTAMNTDWQSAHQRPFLHFAVQSGSNEILKRMNRRYTREEFINRTEAMKRFVPEVSITTDIIVGFPKETHLNVEDTASLMQEVQFSMAFISEYSPRKGTAAGLLKDDISFQQKTKSKEYLNDEILAKSSKAFNERLIGSQQLVFIERFAKGHLQARTAHNRDVRITNCFNENMIGQFVVVKITNSSTWSLEAEIL